MLEPGLVSVTFRQLPPEQIVRLAAEHGLRCVEWGGDVHAPHGDVDAAQRVRKLTIDAGLRMGAYGSYYRLGVGEGPDFDAVLDSAQALGVPSIRVWAGTRGSGETSAEERTRVAEDGRRVAQLARRVGIRIGLEFHANTLTDDAVSARTLWREIGSDHVDLNWQPPNPVGFEQRRQTLLQVLPHLGDVHVFHWTTDAAGRVVRHPLAEARDDWMSYLGVAAGTRRPHRCLLEFVPGDDPAALPAAAATLHALLAEVGGPRPAVAEDRA